MRTSRLRAYSNIIAVAMLLYSRRVGKNCPTHMQFDTIRVFRTVYGNFVRASPQGNEVPWSLGDLTGKYQRLNKDECGSLWFTHFIEGLKARMGQTWLPNKALSTKQVLEILKIIDSRLQGVINDNVETHRWTVFKAYVTKAYVLSLRGPEGPLLDLDGLNRHWRDTRREYFTVALLGRVKGETLDR